MLKSLYIQNYALINKLNLDFNKGLNVITGETGAGKSILIGALGLILGNRADGRTNNTNGNKCIIEGSFDSSSKPVLSFLENNNLDIENELQIRREINKNGKSRAFINDTPVSLSILKELSSLLVDVNSQNQSYMFRNSDFQMAMLDDLSESTELLQEYKQLYANFKIKKKILKDLILTEEESIKHKDFIQFQFDELSEAKLIDSEDDELKSKLEWMDNAETIKQTLFETTQALSLGDETVVEKLELIISQLTSLNKFQEKYNDLQQRLNSVLIEVQDIAAEYENMFEETEFDPQQHIIVKERNDLILRLQQKHRKNSVSELLDVLSGFEDELQSIDNVSDRIIALRLEIEELEKKLKEVANKLSLKRKQAIKRIEKKIVKSLHSLGMKDAVFLIDIKQLEVFTESGIDIVNFLFSSNKGHSPGLVSKIASGGELSRLVLSLKALYSSNKALPTVIFDEIDSGISGDIASKVGSVMKQMSENMQVIAITHLPQIAAKHDWHYKVFKKEVNNITQSDIRLLSASESIEEFAMMISGDSNSKQALKMASELMN
jgi:DNA repair protein RecN (Recombination protein N)